jgi:hypothetical protein
MRPPNAAPLRLHFVVVETDKGYHEIKYVHDIVAEVFVPNPDGKAKVRHKNGNRKDNRAENLEWCD